MYDSFTCHGQMQKDRRQLVAAVKLRLLIKKLDEDLHRTILQVSLISGYIISTEWSFTCVPRDFRVAFDQLASTVGIDEAKK